MVLITTLVITTSTREFGIISKLSRPKTGIPPYVGVWTVLEQGEHLARRNEILEIMGGRRGVGRYSNGETVSPLKTTSEIAKEIGLSETSALSNPQNEGLKTTTEIAHDIGLSKANGWPSINKRNSAGSGNLKISDVLRLIVWSF